MVIAANWAQHWLENRKASDLATVRKRHLYRMLKGAGKDGWMSIETLSRVIGAEPDETRRLLIEIDARGSLKKKEVWSLISRNALPIGDEDEDG